MRPAVNAPTKAAGHADLAEIRINLHFREDLRCCE